VRARIRLSGGTFTVTDGAFAGTKELIGGFAITQAKSKEEAIEWTKRFLKVAGDGESEIRQLHEDRRRSGRLSTTANGMDLQTC
jgi:hypothetical protein